MFTGKGREEVAMQALNLGADGYFNKSGHAETVYGELAHGIRQVVDKRRAEQSFLKSEDKYRRLVETLREGIWVIDKDSRTTFVNPRTAEILGYDIEEMKGRHLFSFMDERGVEIAKRLLERRQQGIKEQHDFEFLRKDGTRIYTTLETSPITDDNGNYIGALASLMDTTERKKMEITLRENEEKWRCLAQNSPDHITLLDRDAKILYINHTVPELTTEEVLGKSIYDYVPSESRKVVADCCQNVLETSKPSSYITQYHTKEGEIRHFDVRVAPVFQSGKVVGIISNSTDITERKKAEESLRESEERFRNIFESANDIMVLCDATGRILDVNKKAVEAFGGSKGELVGKHFTRACLGIIPPDNDKVVKGFVAGLANKKPNLNITIKNKKGQTILLECSASLTKLDDKSTGLLVVGRDITERKNAEEELAESEKKYRSLVEQSLARA
jgi:PAS domain S-box-containing protein